MSAERRLAYVSHLIGVREKLHHLRDTFADGGEALRPVVEEVMTALAMLSVENPLRQEGDA